MSSELLQVPHRLQMADGYCLPACVEMVLAFWGIDQNQRKLAAQMQTIADGGTPVSRVNRLASHSLKVDHRSGEINDLQSAIQRGIPPIALVLTGELPYWDVSTAHAVVVVGYDDSAVWVNDPGQIDHPIRISEGDFQLAWDEMVNRYVILEPKRQ